MNRSDGKTPRADRVPSVIGEGAVGFKHTLDSFNSLLGPETQGNPDDRFNPPDLTPMTKNDIAVEIASAQDREYDLQANDNVYFHAMVTDAISPAQMRIMETMADGNDLLALGKMLQVAIDLAKARAIKLAGDREESKW